MLGFYTAAWTLAPRDRFVGWSRQLREKNLPLVSDNPRFLILPWVRIPNLGSDILALVRRELPRDWSARDNTSPVLIETFVPIQRYTGAVPRLRLDPRRNHQGPRPLRHQQPLRQVQKGHLAPAPPTELEGHPQPIEPTLRHPRPNAYEPFVSVQKRDRENSVIRRNVFMIPDVIFG